MPALLVGLMLVVSSAPLAAPAQLRPRTLIDVRALRQGPEAPQLAAAERALLRHDIPRAIEALEDTTTPAAQLVRARVALVQGDTLAARVALAYAAQSEALSRWVQLERGRLALADGEQMQAAVLLEPLWRAQGALGPQAALPLAAAWAIAAPSKLMAEAERMLREARHIDPHARGRLLGWLAIAQHRSGNDLLAAATLMRRFVEEAGSSETPTEPPPGPPPTPEQLLDRLEHLVDGHRNRQAQSALAMLDRFVAPERLAPALRCRRAALGGILARKLHQYRQSERMLGEAIQLCPPGETLQKAAFMQAKVISIQDGLRALGPIERFVTRYPSGSMVDDVLLWAGDSLQRRGRYDEASRYFARILALKVPDDQCGEAAFRLAWMAYEQHDVQAARRALEGLFAHNCPLERAERARALLWLARFEKMGDRRTQARKHLAELGAYAPMSFYGQVGLAAQLADAAPKERARLAQARRALSPAVRSQAARTKSRALCVGRLADEPALRDALTLLEQGLLRDAARELTTLIPRLGPAQTPQAQPALEHCNNNQSALLLAELLSYADAPKAAQQLLQRHFAQALSTPPTARSLPVWLAAYPLAFGPQVAAAERLSRLPALLLQALAREESSFDPHVVSWAEAYGLTQLLLGSAQLAARSITPSPQVSHPEQLDDPELNLRLGGALLRLYLDRVHDNVALGLAAYNGGLENARTWADRYAGAELLHFVEQISIRETRMYVRRVLETWGIYRWLYEGQTPTLPTLGRLPAKDKAAPDHKSPKRGNPPARKARRKPARR